MDGITVLISVCPPDLTLCFQFYTQMRIQIKENAAYFKLLAVLERDDLRAAICIISNCKQSWPHQLGTTMSVCARVCCVCFAGGRE